MTIDEQLSEEEQSMMIFVKRHFEAIGNHNALRILNESENILDVRAIVRAYRQL